MALHVKLLQVEMYLPDVSSTADILRALGPLRRLCKNQDNIALSIEPFSLKDRGICSIIVAGSNKIHVEQESEKLLNWIESTINGQTLTSEINWL